MKKVLKWLAFSSACALLIEEGYHAWTESTSGLCDDEQAGEIDSPDGNRRATVYHRGCGATVGPIVVVKLSVVLWAFPVRESTVFIIDADTAVAPMWIDSNNLELRYFDTAPNKICKLVPTTYGVSLKVVPSWSSQQR